MKKSLILLVVLTLCCLNQSYSQQKLNYSWGTFSTDTGQKADWKNAHYLFEHDAELLEQYKKFRSTKKTANGLGIATIAQVGVGLLLAMTNGNNCGFICAHQVFGILMVVGTAPLTGLIGIIVAATASSRKSMLIYKYDRQNLSQSLQLDKDQPYLSISSNGLGISLKYHF